MEDITKNLTDSQSKSLEQFKTRLEDVLTPDYTDATLVKWLRARNFDVKRSEQVFRENYNNRILYGINTLIDTYEKPEIIKQYEATATIGFAKDGSLIRYTAVGRIDYYGFAMAMSCHELCIYCSHMMECDIQALKEQSIRIGKTVDEVTYILDFEGLHLQQFFNKTVIEMTLDFIRLLQDCYPEIWRYVLVVNAPSIFDTAFNILKPVLHVHTLERIKMTSKDSTKDFLLKYIDEDVLPAFLGGQRVDSDGDPMCKEFLKFGGKVPEKLYSLNRSTTVLLSPNDPGVKCLVIRQRSTYNQSLAVKEGGSLLKIQIRSENGSVTTSVFHREFGEKEDSNNPEFPAENEYLDNNDENCRYKQISVCLRAQMHCCPVELEAFLQRPGIYVLRLSNAGNWFTSRKVLLLYTLHPPNTESTTQQQHTV